MSLRILVLCTGNVCRSPLAEQLLGRELARRGVDAQVSSAGVVRDGRPAAPEIVELLGERGLDGWAHRSRVLDTGVVAGADLVLGMAREHVREAVLIQPDLFPRAFTLRELVRRGRAVGPRGPDEALPVWLDRAADGRRPADLLGSSPDDDIADPIGAPMAVFRRVATEITELTRAVADLGWPVRPG